MDKKLSVLQRSTDKTGWDKSNQFSSTDVKEIKVFTARNDKSLNAIPSPLARIHLFEAAFALLDKDELNRTNFSGDTYKKIISDCFDVFELIYNWNNHIKNKSLSIIKWNSDSEIESLKKGRPKHKLLGETLEVFLKQESFENFNDILIIKFNNKVIAGSSPFTGFFTTPNDLSQLNFYNPFSRRNYFSKIVSFKERKPEIKKFISDFFGQPSLRTAESTLTIRNYLNKYKTEIDSNLVLQLEELKSSFNQLFNNKLQSCSGKTESDYFEKYLVKINYRINDECFYIPSNSKSERKHDYLLPLSSTFFEDFKVEEIPSLIIINEIDSKTVEVSIKNNTQKFQKKYQIEKILEEDGQIIDLSETNSIKFNLGIFPFLKVMNKIAEGQTEATESVFNDFYKIMFVCQDLNNKYSNNDYKLFFGGNKGKIIETKVATILQINKENRTVNEKYKSEVGSTYYSLIGKNGTSACFKYIQIQFPKLNDLVIKGVIAPKWQERTLDSKQIDYSIDFGTTTTFIAFNDDPKREKSPSAFELNENEIPVALFNKPKTKGPYDNCIDVFEKALSEIFPESIEVQKQEFVPSILNQEKYNLPFRTAVYGKQVVTQKNLFANSNIGFTYQKQDNFATDYGQEFITNLKWNINSSVSYEESVKIFIEELFHLLRIKTLLNNGDPRKSNVSWFSPISFTAISQKKYEDIWQQKFKEIFKGDAEKQLSNITESEAPYYYFSRIQKDETGSERIADNSSVLTLDIGGGTTDLMYFRNGKPILGSSVYFGANIIWGNGFSSFTNEKSNGIYHSIKDSIIQNLNSSLELKTLNDKFTKSGSNYGSDEIINFWILNEDKSKVLRELSNGKFTLSYLLHFSALIYHAMKLLKDGCSPSYSAPTCIIFSGNGSKYLNLIQRPEFIQNICRYFSNKIFDSTNTPQLILPNENRKEATCYGGLYQPFKQARQFSVKTYLGFEKKDESFKKYSDIDYKKEIVFTNLLKSFNEFIELFFAMNDKSDLVFKAKFGIDDDLNAMKNYLLCKAAENLKTGFDKRRSAVGANEDITDSLFFYPFIGLIYQMNNLSKDKLYDFIPKTTLYAFSPDGDNGFDVDRISPDKKSDSIYLITINDSHPDYGEITLISESSVYKRVLSSISNFLAPVCEYKELPANSNQSINVLLSGKIEKLNNRWIVKEKIQIEFI